MPSSCSNTYITTLYINILIIKQLSVQCSLNYIKSVTELAAVRRHKSDYCIRIQMQDI